MKMPRTCACVVLFYSLQLCLNFRIVHPQVCAVIVLTLSPCSAQAPGDEAGRCVSSNTDTFPDTVRNLMDSYNYEQLLRGSGTGNPPVHGAVWTDRSVDGNDVTGTDVVTYVSIQYRHII